MSDPFWQAFFIFASAVLIAGIQAWTSTKTKTAIVQASVAAGARSIVAESKVEGVRTTLITSNVVTSNKLNNISNVLDSTHILVNRNYGNQLKLTEIALRRLAQVTKEPEDFAAADEALKLYKEHMQNQAKVDTKL